MCSIGAEIRSERRGDAVGRTLPAESGDRKGRNFSSFIPYRR